MSLNDSEVRDAILRVVHAHEGTWSWNTMASLRASCSGFRATLTGALPDVHYILRPTREVDEANLRNLSVCAVF